MNFKLFFRNHGKFQNKSPNESILWLPPCKLWLDRLILRSEPFLWIQAMQGMTENGQFLFHSLMLTICTNLQTNTR